ncbi:hypothetical protein AA0120_g2573 [Alternaria tenuissima]|nr:hypothetical protein AA0120_g2573 [Alternaria tenuissima]
MFLFVGAAFSAVLPSAAKSDIIFAPIVPTFMPRSDALCLSRGNSTAPEPSSNSLSGFAEDAKYNSLALSAPVPTGYALAMSNANCAFSSTKYMLYVQLKSYSPETCAELCNKYEGCDSFNIYIQRDPSVVPGPACPNPAPIFVTKCALYSEPEQLSSCTNFGQHVGPVDADGEAFKIAMRGSNAYKKVSPVREVFVTVTKTETIFTGNQKDRRTLFEYPTPSEYDATTTVRIPKTTPEYVHVGPETVITPAGTITTTITLSGPVATTTTITLPRPVVTTTTTTTLDSPDPTSTTTTTINYPGPMVTTTYAGPDSTVTVYGKRDIAAAHFKGKEEGEERWNAWTKEWRPAPHCCDITTTATRIGTRRPHHVLPSYVPRSVIDPEVIMVYPTPTTFSGGSRTWTLEFAGRTSTITTTLTHEWQPATIEAGTYTATLSSIDRSKRPSATATDASDMIKDRPEPMKTITLDDSYTYTGPTDVPMKTITLRA